MRTRIRVSVRVAVAARQWVKACLVLMFSAGCITTPKECRVTKIYRDAGNGLRLAASVEMESTQQLQYRLSSGSFFFLYLCFGKEWDILRNEALIYRRTDADAGIREERQILVEATKSPFLWMTTANMIQMQEAIFNYVMTTVDEARREVKGKVDQEVLWDGALKAYEQHAKAELGGATLDGAADEALVRTLSELPYTVAHTDLPTTEGSAVVTYTCMQVNDTGGCQITTTTVTTSGPMPFVNSGADFKIRVVRRFTSAKSGKFLGSVDDTYVLKSKKVWGDGVCQTLIK